jgi:hypothetical protein
MNPLNLTHALSGLNLMRLARGFETMIFAGLARRMGIQLEFALRSLSRLVSLYISHQAAQRSCCTTFQEFSSTDESGIVAVP